MVKIITCLELEISSNEHALMCSVLKEMNEDLFCVPDSSSDFSPDSSDSEDTKTKLLPTNR